MADETTETVMTDDAFEMAFEAAAAEVSGGSETEKEEKDEVVDETTETESPGSDTSDADAEAKAAEEARVAEEAKRAEAEKAAQEKAKAKEAKRLEQDAKARAKAEEEAAKRKEEEEKLAAERSKLEAFSDEEKKALEATKENFTEVATALEAHSRVMMAKLESLIEQRLKALEATFGEKFGKVEQVAQAYAGDKFMSAVAAKHPDALDVLPKVEDWIASQPSMLQKAYNAVLDKGTVEETIELLDAFKAATTAPVVDTKAAEEKAAKEAEEKKKKEEKLKAQEGVRGRSTVKRAEIDPDDFEGAFHKFAATA